MQATNPLVDSGQVTSFQGITTQLTELEKVLDTTRLTQFKLFNKAYLVVTNNINSAVANQTFDNPDFIEKFTVCFSRYYFRAINGSVAGGKDLPPAWKLLYKDSSHKQMPRFILLMMGANAHINSDLPLALVELMSKEESEALLKDILKLDKILMKSGREIIGLFDEPNKVLDFLKRRFIFLYYRPAMYTILYWRFKAWHDYHEIKEHGLIKHNFQNRSIRIASCLIWVGRTLGTVKTGI